MINNPYPKSQNHILQIQDIFAFLPCSPSIQYGIMLQNMQKRLCLHVYISHFVYLDDNNSR